MPTSFNPAILTSSPLRQLYEVLTVFEAQRDWSIAARATLLDKVAARLPPTHQPDVFLLHSMLEELGVDVKTLSDLKLDESEDVPSISRFSRSAAQAPTKYSSQVSTSSTKQVPALSPQLASIMTTKEMSALVMLQLFGELSEKRIESWGRIAKLIVTQPMNGFATVR